MKLFIFILSIIVPIAAIYCFVYLFFYGMAMEDSMSLMVSLLFLLIAYLWCILIKPLDNEYFTKIKKVIHKLCEED